MKTKNIEDIVAEFFERNDCIMCYGKEDKQRERLTATLTQLVKEVEAKVGDEEYNAGFEEAREGLENECQSEVQEAVEVERERIINLLQDFPKEVFVRHLKADPQKIKPDIIREALTPPTSDLIEK